MKPRRDTTAVRDINLSPNTPDEITRARHIVALHVPRDEIREVLAMLWLDGAQLVQVGNRNHYGQMRYER